MSEISLQGSFVVSSVGQGQTRKHDAACVALNGIPASTPARCIMRANGRCERASLLAGEHEGRLQLLLVLQAFEAQTRSKRRLLD